MYAHVPAGSGIGMLGPKPGFDVSKRLPPPGVKVHGIITFNI
jgi:hypothetical protein